MGLHNSQIVDMIMCENNYFSQIILFTHNHVWIVETNCFDSEVNWLWETKLLSKGDRFYYLANSTN